MNKYNIVIDLETIEEDEIRLKEELENVLDNFHINKISVKKLK